jgi:branched-subunit amino acid transport protein
VTTSPLDPGFGGYLVLFAVGVLVHEPWRWLGLVLGRKVDADGEVFRWVRAVSAALVAGLVMRLVLFPAGALLAVSLPVRITAFAVAVAVFLALRRNLAAGIAAGAGLLALQVLGGA